MKLNIAVDNRMDEKLGTKWYIFYAYIRSAFLILIGLESFITILAFPLDIISDFLLFFMYFLLHLILYPGIILRYRSLV